MSSDYTTGLHGEVMWHSINAKHQCALLEYRGTIKLVNLDESRTQTGMHAGADLRKLPIDRLVVMFPDAEDVIVAYCGLKDYRC
jgi:hypothetical protein